MAFHFQTTFLFLLSWINFAGASFAAETSLEGKTAPELLQAGEAAFNAGHWAEASTAFETFLTDYANVPEVVEAMRRVRPLQALCQMRMEAYETAVPLLEECLADPKLEVSLRSTLQYSLGISYLKTSQFEKARRALGVVFSDAKADTPKRADALVLGGMTYLLEENWKGAVEFFKKYGALMRQFNPEAAARAEVLNLHALMKAELWDEALIAGKKLRGQQNDVRQIVSLHSLLLQIGEHFLQTEEPQKAVAMFILVERRETMLTTQTERLEELRLELTALEASPQGFVQAAQVRGTIADVEKELEALEKMPEFDAALRLRLASAFQNAGRLREAAFVLDQMIRQMEPSATVESASAGLLRLWMMQERWKRAVRSADLYLERFANFPDARSLPEVLFLRAQALQGTGDFQNAASSFAGMAEQFPEHELAPRALFMEAQNYLNLEQNEEALKRFSKLLGERKKDEVWEDAYFWKGMALYFDQKWEEALEHFQNYLNLADKSDVSGQYVGEVKFRRAYARFSEALYEDAIKEYRTFLSEHPDHEYVTEAKLTLGDALAAVGQIEEAIEQYREVSPDPMAFFEDAWFKIGKVLKAQERFAEMRAHYETFVKEHPQSQRVTEALQMVGWCCKKEGRIDEAKEIYWNAILEHGNQAKQISIEDITLALAAFYTGETRHELELKLEHERESALQQDKKTLATRLAWAQAQCIAKAQPAESRKILLKIATELNVEEDNPRISNDCANAAFLEDNFELAEKLYDGIRKWHPRSLWRDQAWAGLGFIAVKRGDRSRALECFDHFERLTVSSKTAPDDHGLTLVEGELGGKVAMARAQILAHKNQLDKAQEIWKSAQKLKSYPARLRADAFWAMAQSLTKAGNHRASLTYYEQIYVLYHRFPDLVAKAYLARGEALEKLGEKQKAREVYSEVSLRKDLAKEPAQADATKRAIELGGVMAPAQIVEASSSNSAVLKEENQP